MCRNVRIAFRLYGPEIPVVAVSFFALSFRWLTRLQRSGADAISSQHSAARESSAPLPRDEVQRPSDLARFSRFCGLMRIKPCRGASMSAIRSQAIEMTNGSTTASFLGPFRDR